MTTTAPSFQRYTPPSKKRLHLQILKRVGVKMGGSGSGLQIEKAAAAIKAADAILLGAGAGIGVDSGLPDFRGNEGFWKAYPPFRGRTFSQISQPRWFRTDPAQAWGFFGHRLNLYRETTPHFGFSILLRWANAARMGFFVFTSNVDGQFQKAGFPNDQIIECHGSIHFMQCSRVCHGGIWPADEVRVQVDPITFRCISEFPLCPVCGESSRPNILMFGDHDWLWQRFEDQNINYRRWLDAMQGKNVVAIEMGAGLAIPTVRLECEHVATTLIRINPNDAQTDRGISIPLGALEALSSIDCCLNQQ